MSFKRVLYLLGQGPRIWRLFRQLWRVLVESKEEELLQYLEDIEKATLALEGAETHEERQEIASQFSDVVSRL